MGTFQVKYADDGDDEWEHASDDYCDDEAGSVAEDFVERLHYPTDEQDSVLVDVRRVDGGEVFRFRVSIEPVQVWHFTADQVNPEPDTP